MRRYGDMLGFGELMYWRCMPVLIGRDTIFGTMVLLTEVRHEFMTLARISIFDICPYSPAVKSDVECLAV